MNGPCLRGLALALIVAAVAADASGQTEPRGDSRSQPRKMVLVELYTSQGCDMCPAAEKILGALAERDRRIVPIAFHVDYFNDPWKDVFSDPLYSQRQMTYNQLYTKPKNRRVRALLHADADDRRRAVRQRPGPRRGRGGDPPGAGQETRRGARRRPRRSRSDGLSGTATIKVTSRSPRAEKTPLLVCAVLREDGVVTDIPSGENAGKSLVARFPARQTKYRVHRARRQVARDATVPVRDRADMEPSEPPAGRVRPGQAHRRGLPGDRPPLAIDPPARRRHRPPGPRPAVALRSPFPEHRITMESLEVMKTIVDRGAGPCVIPALGAAIHAASGTEAEARAGRSPGPPKHSPA